MAAARQVSRRLTFQLLVLVYSQATLLSEAFAVTHVRRRNRQGQNNQYEDTLLLSASLRMSSSSASSSTPSSFAQLFDEPTASWNDEVSAEADRAFRRGMLVCTRMDLYSKEIIYSS